MRESMVALCHAARDVQVDVLVLRLVALDEFAHAFFPFIVRVRVGDAYAIKAALQAHQVLVQPERAARVHRDDFVDAVAENEPAV